MIKAFILNNYFELAAEVEIKFWASWCCDSYNSVDLSSLRTAQGLSEEVTILEAKLQAHMKYCIYVNHQCVFKPCISKHTSSSLLQHK